jgi:hypothetical protein
MKNSFIMGSINSRYYLPQNVGSALRTDRAFTSKKIVKSLALDVFHDEEEHSFSTFTEVGDINDVRMTN